MRHVSDPTVFADDEAPTRKDTPQAQAAVLLADWRDCSIEQREFLSRTARRLADISRKRRAAK
jgi:hypothetical protein